MTQKAGAVLCYKSKDPALLIVSNDTMTIVDVNVGGKI